LPALTYGIGVSDCSYNGRPNDPQLAARRLQRANERGGGMRTGYSTSCSQALGLEATPIGAWAGFLRLRNHRYYSLMGLIMGLRTGGYAPGPGTTLERFLGGPSQTTVDDADRWLNDAPRVPAIAERRAQQTLPPSYVGPTPSSHNLVNAISSLQLSGACGSP
jgi:hypothetical protein